jgi:hypothetical protein
VYEIHKKRVLNTQPVLVAIEMGAGEITTGTAGFGNIGAMGGTNHNAMGMAGFGDGAMGMAGTGYNAAGAAGMGTYATGVAGHGDNAGGPAGMVAQAAGAAGNSMGNGSPKLGTVLAALEKEMEKSKANPDRHKKEFTWQKDYGQGRMADFKLDVLSPQFGILAFGVVQKSSPIIKVVHCIGKFLDIDGPGDLHGKVIGFHGERTALGGPAPLVMLEKNTWVWNEKVKIINDPVAWGTWWANEANRKAFWQPAVGLTTEVALPRMVALPAIVAKFAVEKPRTAKEVYDFINQLVADDDLVLEDATVDFIKTWMMAAGQTEVGAGKALGVALDVQAALSADPVFMEWANGLLDSVLGKKEEQVVANQQGMAMGQHFTAFGNNTILERLIFNQNQILLQQHAAVARDQAADRAKKSDRKDPYTEYEVAKLFGWAHFDRVEELPQLWKDFLTSKAQMCTVHRTLIMNRLKEWSVAMGIRLTKDQVKDIVELNFSPGGVIGLLSNADSGLSNLGCLPRTFAEIAAIKQLKAKEEQAKDNMTITDLNKKMARGKRVPPTSWDGLQRNVGTTLGMVAITCGERSNIYAKLHEVHMVLHGGYVSAIEGWAYTAQKCRQYTWVGVELTPEKFGPRVQFVNYPRLLVDNLIEKMR